MEQNKQQTAARRLSVVFTVLAAVIVLTILTVILVTPYDSGVLAGSALSGNNQYGGHVVATNDYVFYTAHGQIFRLDRGTDEIQSIYQGDVSCLNPYDGWLYFVQNGQIMRAAYYGGLVSQIGTARQVRQMSVNGLWIYYTDAHGVLYKIRSDGQQERPLTDGTVKVAAFEAANRIVVFTDGTDLYRMKTDGTDCTVLARVGGVDRMLYTLDDLFYSSGGRVHRLQSVEAGQSDGTDFSGVEAEIFTYNTNSQGRGQIFYLQEESLRVRKLKSVEDKDEEDVYLARVPGATDVYSIGGDVYYHDAAGGLYRVIVNDSDCTVEPVG